MLLLLDIDAPLNTAGMLMNSTIVQTLNDRGFLSQLSDPALETILAKPAVVYAGFDPTAASLHIGNLLQIMLLAQFQRHGHKPIALVGGATAMIGDPSGKSAERNLLDTDTIAANIVGIRGQLEHFLDFDGPNAAVIVNNADWLGKFSFLDFLRDVGKHFRVGEMMGKESVRQRLNSDTGMSFTEFSYQMLQAYDFMHLHQAMGCTVQTGGDDQWGNITAGIDLTRKLLGKTVYGITSPLITDASGAKFGKTATGEKCWLDSALTRPYDYYQFWLRSDDRDVIKLLKYFTFLDLDTIAELARSVESEPEKRLAHKALAAEATALLHGADQVALVQKASDVLFGQEITGLNDAQLLDIFADVPGVELKRSALDAGYALLDMLCDTKACASRGAAKKLLASGGVYINNVRQSDPSKTVTPADLASETVLVLRTGKKNYVLVRLTQA